MSDKGGNPVLHKPPTDSPFPKFLSRYGFSGPSTAFLELPSLAKTSLSISSTAHSFSRHSTDVKALSVLLVPTELRMKPDDEICKEERLQAENDSEKCQFFSSHPLKSNFTAGENHGVGIET